jgi:hypothetical protein
MHLYSLNTYNGRTVALDDVHQCTADQERTATKAAAKALRHAARRHGKQEGTGLI